MTSSPESPPPTVAPSRVLLRARSGPDVGMGHVMRTLAVALEIQRQGGEPVVVVDDPRSAELLRQRDLEVRLADAELSWTDERARAAWLDGRGGFEAEMERLVAAGTPAFLVENRGRAREESHRVIYPALHYRADDWDAQHEGRVLAGPGWIPLAGDVCRQSVSEERDLDLLVTFGGSDPFELTERSLEVLTRPPEVARAAFWPRRIAVAIGPHMAARRDALERRFGERVEWLPTGGPLAPHIARARLALTAVGTTLYELAYLGVSALVLANYADDHDALEWYAEHGPHRPVGVASELSQEGLRAALVTGLAEIHGRPAVYVPGLGDGSRRLAEALLAAAA